MLFACVPPVIAKRKTEMGVTKIEWCDFTHNEWIGCSKVSPGCENCYAEELMDTRYGRTKWGPNGTRDRTAEANRKKPLTWDRAAKKAGVRYRVFCSSLSDVFEDRDELIPWRQRLFHTIDQTPNLDWLVLTKRPENVLRFGFEQQLWWPDTSFPRNVWIGTSVEDQKRADERIPELLKIPATIRFLSMEPLLGPVDLHMDYLPWGPDGASAAALSRINWVIVGGESGRKARPMHPAWVWSIRNQCQASGVPFFFKQWGEWVPRHSEPMKNEPILPLYDDGRHGVFDDQGNWRINEGEWSRYDNLLGQVMYRVGKKIAGRMLDGREWSEFPQRHETGG
jgi:protein gp37